MALGRAGVITAGLVLLAATAFADDDVLYRWRDETGQVHYTQGRSAIPERFRAAAVPMGAVTSPAPAPAPPKDAAPAPPREAEKAVDSPAEKRVPPRTPPSPRSPERRALDERLESARTTSASLGAGAEYLAMGLPLGAKTAANKAASQAQSAADWKALADFYDSLGDADAAAKARRRSAELAEWERGYSAPPTRQR